MIMINFTLDSVVSDIADAIDSRGDNNVYGVAELHNDDMIVESRRNSRTFLFADAMGNEYRCTIQDVTNDI
jgi:hypothetical protein